MDVCCKKNILENNNICIVAFFPSTTVFRFYCGFSFSFFSISRPSLSLLKTNFLVDATANGATKTTNNNKKSKNKNNKRTTITKTKQQTKTKKERERKKR